MASASPAPFLSSAAPPDLLQAALEISLTGFILFRALHDSEAPATITDLAYEHLNPAAQRMLRLPERPAESFLTLYPNTVETGIFAFYRDTFLAGQAGRYDVNYQHDGLDNFFQLTARRAGDLLVVSFSDTSDQPRTAVEEALRESQAAEKPPAPRPNTSAVSYNGCSRNPRWPRRCFRGRTTSSSRPTSRWPPSGGVRWLRCWGSRCFKRCPT
jgi:hypothetical protein